MIISQALKIAAKKLAANKISIPHLEAEILLSGVLKKQPEFLLTHGEKRLSQLQIKKYQLLLKRRLKGEPIAYLTGHKEFYGLDFIVNKNVLIPRPETELMVEEALKLIAHLSAVASAKENSSQLITLIDVGTGSGCIIITLAKSITPFRQACLPARQGFGGQANYKFLATDISAKALAVAKQNAKAHGVNKKIKYTKGNLLTPLINNSKLIIKNSKLIIVANLPYGWPAWKNNCSLDTIGLKFEPKIALFTGKNGFGLYERLFKQIKKLRVMGCPPSPRLRRTSGLRDVNALCEIDHRQTKMIKKLIKKYLPQAKLQIKKDLAGLNRLLIIKI